MIRGKGLIPPGLGAPAKMKKSFHFDNTVPRPYGTTGQMNEPGDMTNPFAALRNRVGIGHMRVIDGPQLLGCGHSPIFIAAAPIIFAVSFGFTPANGTAIVPSRPDQAGGQVFDGSVVISDKSLRPTDLRFRNRVNRSRHMLRTERSKS